ncbi:MAG TPA: NAD(P)-binding domain-containing protein [Thermoplasmata archaeon]|nr:NAD(P)-binding domain-containing protein [Thermoplasmata archaeon]
MAEPKRVGILGSGDVAKALGRGFAAHGYEVMLGTRDPKKLDAWKKETDGKVAVGTFAQAAAHGPTVVLATHGAATEAVLDQAGPQHFRGKLVLDATNPLDFSRGMPPGLLFGLTDSLGERVQRKLPDAKVVKCFNTVSNVKMVDPKFAAGPARMWICGNDAEAKRATEGILRELGWAGALDVGAIDGARWLEAMVPLWVRVGVALNTWEHMLQLVR